METLISDEEQQLFCKLFTNLDLEKKGKLSFKSVTKFLSNCGIDETNLGKIFYICGAKRLGSFGRSQFYIALKSVSLIQNNLKLTSENLSLTNIPLPKFNNLKIEKSKSSENNVSNFNQESNLTLSNSNTSNSCYLPPPPSSSTKVSRARNKQYKNSIDYCECIKPKNYNDSNNLKNSTYLEFQKNNFLSFCNDCKKQEKFTNHVFSHTNDNLFNKDCFTYENTLSSSPDLFETTGSQRNINYDELKTWQKIERDNLQDPNYTDSPDEAKHCLLTNDEYENISNIENKADLEKSTVIDSLHNKNNIASTNLKKDSDGYESEDEVGIWSISDELIIYYCNKFISLLPCKNNKLLEGLKVKSFFERSKLPLSELKLIWYLSDLDNDGKLSLTEFCIAMHLVVLRRNNIELPEILPQCLVHSNVENLIKKKCIEFYEQYCKPNSQNQIKKDSLSEELCILNIVKNREESVSSINSLISGTNETSFSPNQNREWTKFYNSPCISPIQSQKNHEDNVKLANFDNYEINPLVLHPISLKATSNYPNSENQILKVNSKLNSKLNETVLNCSSPPPPPPRCRRLGSHARSSSLDLNKKKLDSIHFVQHQQGVFVNYRKHLQQQQDLKNQNNHQIPINSNKQYYVNYLRNKYALPNSVQFSPNQLNTSNLIETVKFLQERIYLIESINDKLIEELASALEKIVDFQKTTNSK